MRQETVEGIIVEKKQSAVKEGVFYITAEVAGWGKIKYVSRRKTSKVGDKVILQTQKNRNMTDIIMWQEVRR